MNPSAPLPRSDLIQLIQAALAVGEARYARRLALAWLAAYPGDLPVSLLHARALLQARLQAQALPLLAGLCLADPEYLEAQELRQSATGPARSVQAKAHRMGAGDPLQATAERHQAAAACVHALGGAASPKTVPTAWAAGLKGVRQTFALGDLDTAEARLYPVLRSEAPSPLAAVTHLRLFTAHRPPPPSLAVRDLALAYHQRWPECIPLLLYLADALMDCGDSDHAVALLHQAAASDITGQVAQRLWGCQHPYQALWPQKLEFLPHGPNAPQSLPVPARVAGALGWNQLPEQTGPGAEQARPAPAIAIALETQGVEPKTPYRPQPAPFLEETAARLGQPALARMDGRFPVYVIFSSRRGLEAQYGAAGLAAVEAGMRTLAQAVKARRKWDALVCFADDAAELARRGLPSAAHTDAWGLKRLLADLDSILARRGERIGALLIAGGPAVIPFHRLPNPVDDLDTDVASDNPYATRDENYFAPEWPVGRIPGDASADPRPLLDALRCAAASHSRAAQPRRRLTVWWETLRAWLGRRTRRPGRSLGYSAAIWRRASLSVYRPIGEPRSLLISPPVEAASAPLETPYELGYFNLHGIVDAVEWYGQRDPTEPGTPGFDYPVALRPEQVQNHGTAPAVVFSEACYGAHIQDKRTDQALALKLLYCGALAVVGAVAGAERVAAHDAQTQSLNHEPSEAPHSAP